MTGICDVKEIARVMSEKKISIDAFCSALEIDKSTYYRKIKSNGKGFTVEEIHKICDVLGLDSDQKLSIFFAETVA